MRKATIIAALALVAACGGSSNTSSGGLIEDPVTDPLSPGSGTTDVTAAPETRYPMTPLEALSYVQSEVCPPFNSYIAPVGLTSLLLELDDAPGRCARVAVGQERAGSGLITILINRIRPDGVVPGMRIGTYDRSAIPGPLPDGAWEEVVVFLSQFSDYCSYGNFDEWSSGSVTIDSADELGVTGSLDVTMQAGGSISGSFATKPCGVDIFQCNGVAEYPATTSCVSP